jgi:hypothetical protein
MGGAFTRKLSGAICFKEFKLCLCIEERRAADFRYLSVHQVLSFFHRTKVNKIQLKIVLSLICTKETLLFEQPCR